MRQQTEKQEERRQDSQGGDVYQAKACRFCQKWQFCEEKTGSKLIIELLEKNIASLSPREKQQFRVVQCLVEDLQRQDTLTQGI